MSESTTLEVHSVAEIDNFTVTEGAIGDWKDTPNLGHLVSQGS